jgi:hypothetical protein
MGYLHEAFSAQYPSVHKMTDEQQSRAMREHMKYARAHQPVYTTEEMAPVRLTDEIALVHAIRREVGVVNGKLDLYYADVTFRGETRRYPIGQFGADNCWISVRDGSNDAEDVIGLLVAAGGTRKHFQHDTQIHFPVSV